MFETGRAFDQNLASWNTASVSSMYQVHQLPSHARGLIALGGVSSIEQLLSC
jgi:hypothetical protein